MICRTWTITIIVNIEEDVVIRATGSDHTDIASLHMPSAEALESVPAFGRAVAQAIEAKIRKDQ